MSIKSNVVFWAIFCCFLWSSAFAGIKVGLEYTTPLQFAGFRFIIAGLITIPFCSELKYYFKFVRQNLPFLLLLAFLQTFLHYILFYMGVARASGAISAIVVGSSPLFVAITSHFTMANDRMSFPKLLTIIAGLTGVSLVAFGRSDGAEGNVELIGIVILLVSNIMGSFNNILIVKEKNNIPPLVISSFSMLIGGIGILLVSIPIEGAIEFTPKPAPYYYSLAWLSFLSAAAISIWTKLLKRPNIVVSELNFWKFLIPVSGAILSWLFLSNETIDNTTIIGMVIIASSLIFLNLYNRNKLSRLSKKQNNRS